MNGFGLAVLALGILALLMVLPSRMRSDAATRKAVLRRVSAEYPGQEEQVLATLDSYEGPEIDRVQKDILLLSAGSLEDLKRWTRWASNDYRDVLTAAEHGDSAMGAEILRTFRERRPDNSINLSWKDLLDEEPPGSESPTGG